MSHPSGIDKGTYNISVRENKRKTKERKDQK
jgi:hypothetical protein